MNKISIFLPLLATLVGCSSLSPKGDEEILLSQINTSAREHLAQFNTLRGASMPLPLFHLVHGKDYYAETWSSSSIDIDYEHCKADLQDCLNDTVPHEEAHAALFFFGYYGERVDIHPSAKGFSISYENTQTAHDWTWCDTMKAFGGNPFSHGNCKENKP